MNVSHPRRRVAIGGTLCAALLSLGAPIAAQQGTDSAPGTAIPHDIPVAEWLDLTLGRTVFYSIEGTPFGREYYAPDGRTVIFQHSSGTCLEGQWTYRAEITAYCYLWPGSTSCFRHVEQGDEMMILPVQSDGSAGISSVQKVDQIKTLPLSCDPAMTS